MMDLIRPKDMRRWLRINNAMRDGYGWNIATLSTASALVVAER
jgi:hypothetical protein